MPPPVPVRKMLLTSPQVVAAVTAAESAVVPGACSRHRRRPARGGGARRGGGVCVVLPIDAVVGRGEDVVDLAARSDDLVEVQAERGEVSDRGLRHGPPRSNGDDSEMVREVPLPLVVGGRWRDPGEDGRIWARGMGEPELLLVSLLTYLAPQVGVVREGKLAATDVTDGKSNDTTVFWGNGVMSENCSSNATGRLVRYKGCTDTPRRNVGMLAKCESSRAEVSKHVIGVEKPRL